MKNIDYRDYVIDAPVNKENIEWSHDYTYNAKDQTSPRVLMIGDSICNGYQYYVRQLLANRVNVSFWITSYCVTRERYFRILDMILEQSRYDLVLFNSGHCGNAMPIWEKSFRSAVRFIGDKLGEVKIGLVYSPPTRVDVCNEGNKARNAVAHKVAEEYGYPVVDLWSPIETLGAGDDVFSDNFHFIKPIQEMQAKIVSDAVCDLLGITEDGDIEQLPSETGPAGALK